MATRPRHNAQRDEAMLILADAGNSVAHIASRFGITRNAVIGALWRARRRHQQPPPPPEPTLTMNRAPIIPRPGPISGGLRSYTR